MEGEYPEGREPDNIIFHHNGIARMAYTRQPERLIISLTNGHIVMFHNFDISSREAVMQLSSTNISDLCDLLEGGHNSQLSSEEAMDTEDASSESGFLDIDFGSTQAVQHGQQQQQQRPGAVPPEFLRSTNRVEILWEVSTSNTFPVCLWSCFSNILQNCIINILNWLETARLVRLFHFHAAFPLWPVSPHKATYDKRWKWDLLCVWSGQA